MERKDLHPVIVGLSVCAGFLNCIFLQGQYGRPLTLEEAAQAHAQALDLAVFYSKQGSPHGSPQEVLRPTFPE